MLMADTKKNERYIPTKNYIIAGGLILLVILLTWYVFAWRKVYKEEKVSTSYLEKYNIITNIITDIDEIKDVFAEVPDSYFIYISYTGNEEIYDMEKDLAKIIKRYNLSEDMYYINVTDLKDKKDYINKLNNTLGLKDVIITQVPTIIYFKDGEVTKGNIISRSDDKLMSSGDFQKLLDKNEIQKQE